MKIFTTNSKITYEIDEENGLVTAILNDCVVEYAKIMKRAYARSRLKEADISTINHRIGKMVAEGVLRDKYSGTAKCCSDDVFDEKIGMEIARSRAILKRELAYAKATQKLFMKAVIESAIFCEISNRRCDKIEATCDILDRYEEDEE